MYRASAWIARRQLVFVVTILALIAGAYFFGRYTYTRDERPSARAFSHALEPLGRYQLSTWHSYPLRMDTATGKASVYIADPVAGGGWRELRDFEGSQKKANAFDQFDTIKPNAFSDLPVKP